jgi:hypothetical protein
MGATIYVEVSFCPQTRALGWGAVATFPNGPAFETSGALPTKALNVTEAELTALQAAVTRLLIQRGVRGGLTIALRSTAAVAVLRWVFPDAPQGGHIQVQPPKKLGEAFTHLQALYDLEEDLTAAKVAVSLEVPPSNVYSTRAAAMARIMMDHRRKELAL